MSLKDSETFEKSELQRDLPIPLYYQIYKLIKDEIESGELLPGDKILTEEKLQKKFGVSRATVRNAISDLVHDGLLEKKPSKGTVVSSPKFEERVYGAFSFAASILQQNKELVTKILEFKTIKPTPEICNKLQLSETEDIRYIKRLRYIDGEPMAVEDWYSAAKNLPGFTIELFEEEGMAQSSYALLQNKYKLYVNSIQDTMAAGVLDNEEAKLLDTYKGKPVLIRQRIGYDKDKVPIAYSNGRYMMSISLEFYADKSR